jgi:hypothetical protein
VGPCGKAAAVLKITLNAYMCGSKSVSLIDLDSDEPFEGLLNHVSVTVRSKPKLSTPAGPGSEFLGHILKVLVPRNKHSMDTCIDVRVDISAVEITGGDVVVGQNEGVTYGSADTRIDVGSEERAETCR